jgi:hypothetical protein
MRLDDVVVTLDDDGIPHGLEVGTPGHGREERGQGAKLLFEFARGGGRRAVAPGVERDRLAGLYCGGGVSGVAEEAGEHREVSGEGQLGIVGGNDPDDGMWWREGCGAEKVGCSGTAGLQLFTGSTNDLRGPGDCEVRADEFEAGGCGGEIAFGEREQVAAVPGKEEARRTGDRIQERACRLRERGGQRRALESSEVDFCDGGGSGGYGCHGRVGRRRVAAGVHQEGEGGERWQGAGGHQGL